MLVADNRLFAEMLADYREPLGAQADATTGAIRVASRQALFEQALRCWEEARGPLENLLRAEPTSLEYHDTLARCLATEGALLLRMNRVKRVRLSSDAPSLFGMGTPSSSNGAPAISSDHRGGRQAWLAAELELAAAEMHLGPKAPGGRMLPGRTGYRRPIVP